MTKLDFDHTNAGFFSLFLILSLFFFCLSQFSDDFPIFPPPWRKFWIRTGTVNEYMRI